MLRSSQLLNQQIANLQELLKIIVKSIDEQKECSGISSLRLIEYSIYLMRAAVESLPSKDIVTLLERFENNTTELGAYWISKGRQFGQEYLHILNYHKLREYGLSAIFNEPIKLKEAEPIKEVKKVQAKLTILN
jgi:hypothetical protein